jgi:hypothetical protein
MAIDYAHCLSAGNRLGLHYSHFQAFLKIIRLQINRLHNEKSLRQPESAKSG